MKSEGHHHELSGSFKVTEQLMVELEPSSPDPLVLDKEVVSIEGSMMSR